MGVVAAGVHHALRLALEGQVVRLLDRQRVHVGAQRHDTAGEAAAQDADDARLRDRVAHLEAEVAQPLGHQVPGALLAVAELGVGVEVAAHGDHGRCDALGRGADRGVGSGGCAAAAARRRARMSRIIGRPPCRPDGYHTRARRAAGHLRGRQLAPLARGQRAELEAADPHAHELEHLVADRGAHAPHLAVLALGEHDLEPGRAWLAARRARDDRAPSGRPRRARAVVERQALAQRAQRLGVGNARDARVVGLRHVLRRAT